jgi:hypothetical protein
MLLAPTTIAAFPILSRGHEIDGILFYDARATTVVFIAEHVEICRGRQ